MPAKLKILPEVSENKSKVAALIEPPDTVAEVRWPIRLTEAEPMPENLPLVAPKPAATPKMLARLQALRRTLPEAVMLPFRSAL